MKRVFLLVVVVMLVGVVVLTPVSRVQGAASASPDAQVAALTQSLNQQLAAQGLDIQVGEIDLFTIGVGRPNDRIHQQFFRWVPGDPRRQADGTNIRYLVRQRFGATPNGLTNAQTEPAIDRAFSTWQADSCVAHTTLEKRPDPGVDSDIFDELIGAGDSATPNFSNLYKADIVEAGFRPRAFFDRIASGGGDFILGDSITFFRRMDINNDGYLDTAFVETYLNANFAWEINATQPSIDVQSVELHESGHALGLGHFGPPPTAVMNPFYAGIRQSIFPDDHAGMCTIWGAWPQV
jgi:hypothetical protein